MYENVTLEELANRVAQLEATQEKILFMLNGEDEAEETPKSAYQDIVLEWNSQLVKLGISKVTRITGQRQDMVGRRLKQYGRESFHTCIENIKTSDFLQGKNNRGWFVTFDWLIKPGNYPKVLEGNYNKPSQQSSSIPDNWGF